MHAHAHTHSRGTPRAKKRERCFNWLTVFSLMEHGFFWLPRHAGHHLPANEMCLWPKPDSGACTFMWKRCLPFNRNITKFMTLPIYSQRYTCSMGAWTWYTTVLLDQTTANWQYGARLNLSPCNTRRYSSIWQPFFKTLYPYRKHECKKKHAGIRATGTWGAVLLIQTPYPLCNWEYVHLSKKFFINVLTPRSPWSGTSYTQQHHVLAKILPNILT